MKNVPVIIIMLVAIVSGFCPAMADKVYSQNNKANKLFKKGDFEGALKLYDDALLQSPGDEKLKMNKAAAQYQLGNVDNAYETFKQAESIKDKKARADLLYNMGNTCFKQAERIARSGQGDASEKYKEAVNNYIKALNLRSSDHDAKWNLQVTQQRIKQQQQQQQQNQKNKDDKNQQNKEDKNQNQQNKNDQKQDQNKDQQQNQDKKDQDKQNQNQNQDKDQQQKPPQPQAQEQNKEDLKKEEARRMLAQFADQADSLNKPQKKIAVEGRGPLKDW